MSIGPVPPATATRSVSQKRRQRVVVLQEVGIFLQDLALGRIIDLFLQLRGAALPRERKQLVHHLERFQVESLGKRIPLENAR
jgi:hypothetical protein